MILQAWTSGLVLRVAIACALVIEGIAYTRRGGRRSRK